MEKRTEAFRKMLNDDHVTDEAKEVIRYAFEVGTDDAIRRLGDPNANMISSTALRPETAPAS